MAPLNIVPNKLHKYFSQSNLFAFRAPDSVALAVLLEANQFNLELEGSVWRDDIACPA